MTAAPRLFVEHLPIADAIARDYFFPDGDEDDVRQEARIALWDACRRYDGRMPFRPFARHCITARMCSQVRNRNREKVKVNTQAARLNGPGPSLDEAGMLDFNAGGWRDGHELIETIPSNDTADGRACFHEVMRNLANAGLSELELRAIRRVMCGYPCGKTGVDNNALNRARRKLKAHPGFLEMVA